MILVFSIIVLLLSFQRDEFVAALSALVFLAVYYLVLYFYRERLDKKFVFTLKL
ncbi:MAG: SoxR reducing system RseC family protein [Bacteroidales bacterium]|nr:SoxR reducing system RseC family protein [Bacteroidales bacterium]